MKLSYLLKDSGLFAETDCEINDICNDSRHIRPGALFFALKGSRYDGTKFIEKALSNGAAAVISQGQANSLYTSERPIIYSAGIDIYRVLSSVSAAFYGRPSEKLTVFGLSGTKGKTTCSYFLEAILKLAGLRPGVIGTLGCRADDKILAKPINTTPYAHKLHSILAEMHKRFCLSVIMEVSSHALALSRAEDIAFDIALFTNFQSDHMDFHKTEENYFLAKLHLFELLAAKGKGKKTAVINADDRAAGRLSCEIEKLGLKQIKYGLGPNLDFSACDIMLNANSSVFTLRSNSNKARVKINLPGLYNVYNALAAFACAVTNGIKYETALLGLEQLKNVPGRMQRVDIGQGFSVFVDYAHTEGALINVLENLRQLAKGRIFTVFGCGGDRDKTKRAPMGIGACRLSDFVYITNDNPRFEAPDAIFSDIESGIAGRYSNYKIIDSRSLAIKEAILRARDGDIVLIAGKGHETYQLINGEIKHFSDAEEAEKILKELK